MKKIYESLFVIIAAIPVASLNHKLTYVMFGVLLTIFLVYVSMPIIRLADPALSKAQIVLDPSAVGLACILVFASFALVLIEKLPASRNLSKLKLSAQGVEAEFTELEKQANEIKEVVPPDVKDEVELIRGSNSDPKVAFLELIIEIEKKLRFLASVKGNQSRKYRPVASIVEDLKQLGVIDRNLAGLIKEFLYFRNKTIHGEIVITDNSLNEAIKIGEIVLSKLEKAYSG